jgi:hypothetical protein
LKVYSIRDGINKFIKSKGKGLLLFSKELFQIFHGSKMISSSPSLLIDQKLYLSFGAQMDAFLFGGQPQVQTNWRLVPRLGAVGLACFIFDQGGGGRPGVVVQQVRFKLFF